MLNQMCWLPKNGINSEKVLYLRTELNKPWLPYTHYPQFAVPDYKIDKGSKGWATYQKLYKLGWKLLMSKDA